MFLNILTMFPDYLLISLEDTTVWIFISGVVSIFAILIAYQFMKNISEKNSSATESNQGFNKLPVVFEDLENEEIENNENSNNEAGDSKHLKAEKDINNTIQASGGGDNTDKDDLKLLRPELLISPDKIPDKLKKAKDKIIIHQLETNMSEDEKLLEKKVQHEQLSEIFKLVAEQNEKYGINSIADMEEQMKLYRSDS